MKKKNLFVGVMMITFALAAVLCGCNMQIIDTTYTYNRAIISLQNGEVLEVDVKSWADYEGEQLQIIATDGTVYLTNSINCTLIQD